MPLHYLLPDNPEPPDDYCILVHVPKDPAYLRAFFGAYEQLGEWWRWQRDPLKLGRVCAARFRQSLRETWDTWDRYGDLCELEIIVNVQCGDGGGGGTTVNCGGCCNCGPYTPYPGNRDPTDIEQIPGLPDDQIDDGSTPPPGWGTYPEYKQDKCNRAHAIVEDFISTLANFGSFGAMLAALSTAAAQALITSAALSPLIVGLMAVGLSAGGAVVVLLGIFAAMAVLGTSTFLYFNIVLLSLDEEEMVCCLYTATSNADAEACLKEYLNNAALAALAAEPGPVAAWVDLFNSLINVLFSGGLLSVLFAGADLLDELVDRDCSACDVAGPLPEPPPENLIFYAKLDSATGISFEEIQGQSLDTKNVVSAPGKIAESGRFTKSQESWMRAISANDYVGVIPYAGSVSLWVNPNGLLADQIYICSSTGQVQEVNRQWNIKVRANPIAFRGEVFYIEGGLLKATRVTASMSLSTIEWYHLVLTWWTDVGSSEGEVNFYVNGVLRGTGPLPVRVNPVSNPRLYIGTQAPVFNAELSDADIDEIAIYNGVLSGSDVALLYNAGAVSRPPGI